MKRCARCKTDKPPDQFRAVKGKPFSWCRPCELAKRAEYAGSPERRESARAYAERFRREHPERAREQWRLGRLARFGITPEDYDRMLAEQGGLCAVCRQPETQRANNGHPKMLAVDHDHITGQVRGLCCAACNVGLGNFRHDPELLAAAIAYLKP